MRLFWNFLCLAMVLLLTACSLDSDESNFTFVNLKITEVNLPETFEHEHTYTVNLTYERSNACVFFEGFDVTETDTTTRYVTAIGTQIQDSDCEEAVEYVNTSFEFTVLYQETYEFYFFNGYNADGEAQYLEYTVAVQPTLTN